MTEKMLYQEKSLHIVNKKKYYAPKTPLKEICDQMGFSPIEGIIYVMYYECKPKYTRAAIAKSLKTSKSTVDRILSKVSKCMERDRTADSTTVLL